MMAGSCHSAPDPLRTFACRDNNHLMKRIVGLFGFIFALALSALVFEFQNIWPFNQDKIQLLRLIFYAFSAMAFLSIGVGTHRWLPAALLALAFALIGILSNAKFELSSFALASFFIFLAAMCTVVVCPPLIRRRI